MALDVDGEAVFELTPLALSSAVELFTRRAASRSGDDEGVEALCRSLDGLPLAIELAAARTKTLSIEEITRRLHDRFSVLSDPTSRRPERRRALKATIQWSYELLFPDDKRGLWALATFAGGAPLPAVESVLEALDVPASAAIDVVGRLASRSLVTVDIDVAPRYRLLDSIRAFALDAMTNSGLTERALAAHAAWFGDAARASTAGVRSARQAEYLSLERAERANIDAALAWSATHDPRLTLGFVNGFGWAWIVLGDSRGARRIVAALEAAGDAAPDRERASALLVAGWIEASTGRLELAREQSPPSTRWPKRSTMSSCRLAAATTWPTSCRMTASSGRGGVTERSAALYRGLDRPWDQAANSLFAARAAISAGDRVRAVAGRERVETGWGTVDDPWLHVRRDAMLGELARFEHRFDDAVTHIQHAAETSARLGFSQTEAYRLSSLGHTQCQAGDYIAGAATLERALEKAEAVGDVRLAALARVHLGRVLRALGRVAEARSGTRGGDRVARGAGGGEQAALGECLLAAMDARTDADARLVAILDGARRPTKRRSRSSRSTHWPGSRPKRVTWRRQRG